MTPEEIEDEAARPRAPAFTLSPFQELNGRGLAAIHRWYLRDLSAVGALMGDIRAGLRQPDELALDPAPVRFEACAQGFAALDRAVRSHFRYEEAEIGPALGYYEVQV